MTIAGLLASDWFTRRGVLLNEVVLWVAVRAVFSGRPDLSEEWEAVTGLLDRLAESEPQLPATHGTNPAAA